MSETTTITDEQFTRIDAAVDVILPEAQEYVDRILRDPIKTTKDNYGKVLAFLSGFPAGGGETAALFLIALVRAGYPQWTALQLVQLMGWPSTVAALIEREATR